PLGIHGVFVERDRQLDQEIGEVARQGRALAGRRGHDAKDTRTGNGQTHRRTGENSKEGAENPCSLPPVHFCASVASVRLVLSTSRPCRLHHRASGASCPSPSFPPRRTRS